MLQLRQSHSAELARARESAVADEKRLALEEQEKRMR